MDQPLPNGADLVACIPDPMRAATEVIATTLAEAGHRAWVVGGAVRDLILDRDLKDIDLVSAALPDQVEELFERTVAVGKSFGIVVVVIDGLEIEVATFRRERGYSDRRRPDEIEFAETPDVDAERRDFTCNALFLDPLNGEVCDPTGGLADLERGELRAVGDARARFREDGLRLLRMARFLATLQLQPADGLLDAVAAERDSIRGVSPERVNDELCKMLESPHAARALGVMEQTGVAVLCLPGWCEAQSHERLARLERLDVVDPIAARAILFGPDIDRAGEHLDALRSSRDIRRAVARTLELASAIEDDAQREVIDAEDLGRRVLLWRDDLRPSAFALARTCDDAAIDLARYEQTMERAARDAPTAPFVPSSRDLMEAGIAAGPRLGEALKRLRYAAIGGAFVDGNGARAWLAAQNLTSD